MAALGRGGSGCGLIALVTICVTVAAGLNVGGTLLGGSHGGGIGSGASPSDRLHTGAVAPEASGGSYRVISNVSVGSFPQAVAYDSGKGELFVANEGSANVSVISDSNNTVVGTVPVGGEPNGVAYDSREGKVFVTNSNDVVVISDSDDKVMGSYTVGTDPDAVAYDSTNDDIYVANAASGTVSVLSAPTGALVATVVVGTTPTAVAYDDELGEVFVANYGLNSVWVICDGSISCGGVSDTWKVVERIAAGESPYAMAYDPERGEVFVANRFADGVSVISTFTNGVVGWVPVGSSPLGVAYDGGKGELFVTNDGSNNVSVISDSNNTVVATLPVCTNPWGVAYDGGKGELFVANYGSDNVSVISVPPSSYAVTFTESGLPSGTEWWVNGTALGSLNSTTGTIVVSEPNGSYPYTVATTDKEYAAAGGTVVVNGAAAEPSVAFSLVTYTVTFTESDLPGGTEWWVNGTALGSLNSTTGTIVVNEPNGSYPYTVATVDKEYAATGGTLVVNGAAASPSVTFSLVTYTVTFTEGGLPGGTEWWVNGTVVGSRSSTTTTISFNEANGSYAYTVASANKEYSASGGSITVNGAAVPEPVSFNLVAYSVAFTESGLPGGTEWWVNITGQSALSSTGTTISSSLPNGSYTYTVASENKDYSASGGSFTVSGAAVPEPVTFSLVTYSVTFTETGLPSGTEWWANITGEPSLHSTGTTITTALPNGSFTYSAGSANKEYAAFGGSFEANGASVAQQVNFSMVLYTVTFTESGLPSGIEWWVNGTVIGSRSSTTNTTSFSDPNGSYSYTLATTNKEYSASGGSFTVNGAAVPEPVAFRLVTYTVTFTESGLLPSGTEWWVNGTALGPHSSTTTMITVSEPNGSYPYLVATLDKVYAAPDGSVVVNGGPASQTVTFTLVTFAVIFTEIGLPPGTNWSVVVAGVTHTAAGIPIVVHEPNGSYAFTVVPVSGYSVKPSNGTVVVSGTNVGQPFAFTSNSKAATFLELPATEGYALIGGIVAVVLVGSVVALLLRRRRGRAPSNLAKAPSGMGAAPKQP